MSELLRGGDLESLIKREGSIDEAQAKFYATQLVLVLGFLHTNDIVYRNLKTSNVLINSDGYIKLGDFDCCSKLAKCDLSNSFLRLKEYQAPEVISNEGHNQTVDWWALGVVLSQMLYNDNVIDNGEIKLPASDKISADAKDLIIRLLERNRDIRIGSQNDWVEILEHSFFSDVDVDDVLAKRVVPAYIPYVQQNDPYYVSNFNMDLIRQAPRESVIMPNEKQRIQKETQVLQHQFDEFLQV